MFWGGSGTVSLLLLDNVTVSMSASVFVSANAVASCCFLCAKQSVLQLLTPPSIAFQRLYLSHEAVDKQCAVLLPV